MYSISKRFALLHVFALVATQLLRVSSLNTTNAYLQHKCITSQGKYEQRSEYEKNLNFILRMTSEEKIRSGFVQVSTGEDPYFISFMFQCRGDSYGPKCRSCYATALSALRKRCPGNKGRIIWYDQCLMEISTNNSEGKIDYDNIFCMANKKNMSGDPSKLKQKMILFIGKLGSKATSEKSAGDNKPVLFATGEEMFGTTKLYAMVQCRKDLWSRSCQVCLSWLLAKESFCCDGKQGGRVFSTSCNYRYELYPFI